MALRSTVHKATLQIADMDRRHYGDHLLTVAQHPSETDERVMMRLLAYALQAPADAARGRLQFARGLSDTDEPDLWQHDLDGSLVHWIEVGQPDERRLSRAASRAERVTVYAYAAACPVWWKGLAGKVARLDKLAVWRIDAAASQSMAGLLDRTMQLQVTVQDGWVWVSDGRQSIELQPTALQRAR